MSEAKYRLALLNVAATGRKWAVAQGGNTPLAIVAQIARDALDMTVEQVDEEIRRIKADNHEARTDVGSEE